MATKKEVLEHVEKITAAMDEFRRVAVEFSFTPPDNPAWLELRRLVEEAKSLK